MSTARLHTTTTTRPGDQALHGDVVAGVEVLDQLVADAGPVEGPFGEHRAPEQVSATRRPITVITGTSALRKAWRRTTLRPIPRACPRSRPSSPGSR